MATRAKTKSAPKRKPSKATPPKITPGRVAVKRLASGRNAKKASRAAASASKTRRPLAALAQHQPGKHRPHPSAPHKPKLAVWKFASCDGCQLSLLDCEDELLAVAGAVEIAEFLEASSTHVKGPFDVSLVEGSITTAHDAERIREVRKVSRRLITIGACATAGGIQALRNFRDVNEFIKAVYARPEYIDTLATSTPIADHVKVDFELRGCPINKQQLLEVLNAFLHERRPNIPHHSVCVECKRSGATCVMVAHGTPCLGPVTQAGCGAICPRYHRGCYGCFGPMETPNTGSLSAWWEGPLAVRRDDVVRAYRGFNAWSQPFREASTTEAHGQEDTGE